jgi:hypothetical protein
MAKKQKQRRPADHPADQPTPDESASDKSTSDESTLDESTPAAPPGASFDTEAGRAAHGMRKDLGSDPPPDAPHNDEEETHEDQER